MNILENERKELRNEVLEIWKESCNLNQKDKRKAIKKNDFTRNYMSTAKI